MFDFFRKVFRKLHRIFLTYFAVDVSCNICGWKGTRKYLAEDCWHPFTICPDCGSEVRHRLMAAAMHNIRNLSPGSLVNGKSVLHFAPEKLTQKLFSSQSKEYRTADFLVPGVDLKLDLCNMPEMESDSVDLVIACDVLEHVPDDRRALHELYRILRSDGWAIITVPQKDNLKSTYEDASITSEAERIKAFGQEDHLRIYGDDFPELLEAHQFRVTTVDEYSFPRKMARFNVLFPPMISPRPLATNHRKVFFAQKVGV